MPALSANGLSIEYVEIGEPRAPAILLIMGLGMQLIAWPESLCQGLADRGFRVVRFDNRDVGHSTKINRGNAISLAAAVVRALAGGRVAAPHMPLATWPRRHRRVGRTRDRAGACRRRIDGRHDRSDHRRRASRAGEEPGIDHVLERRSEAAARQHPSAPADAVAAHAAFRSRARHPAEHAGLSLDWQPRLPDVARRAPDEGRAQHRPFHYPRARTSGIRHSGFRQPGGNAATDPRADAGHSRRGRSARSRRGG